MEEKNIQKVLKHYIFAIICIVGLFWAINMQEVEAAEDPNSVWSNISTNECTSRNGCSATAVYSHCYFYCNFWNPNGNIQMRSATVKIKNSSGSTVYSNSYTAGNYMNYVSFPIYLTASGTYTLERSVTRTNGNVLTWDAVKFTLNDVSKCGSQMSLSSTSASLSMTGTSSRSITVKITGVTPKSYGLSYSKSNSNVNCSWGGWYDSNGDGTYDANTLNITGQYGGSSTVTISLYESTTDTTIVSKSVSVTIGPNYTVSYNANGGSGAPSSQTKYYGKSLTLSSTKPTRTGYTFQGWGTSSSDTSVDYSAGGSYTRNSDITLYAIWKPVEYTVSYNANGGSGAPSSQIKKHDITLTLSSTKPTRTGHTFQGWGTSSSDTSVDYSPGGSYTKNSSITLYAIWKPVEYTVSYNANGGSGAPSSQKKKHDITLTLSSTEPTRTGHTFQGWGTSTNDTTVDYKPGDKYTNNSSITLYAIWKQDVYYVHYNANGGSDTPSSQIKYHGTTLTLSTQKPKKDGYIFQGWGTSANDTSVDYYPGDKYTNNSGITLYAIWKPVEYTVTYNVNGGSGALVSQIKYHDITLTLFDDIKLTRAGYIFQGWGISANDTTVDYKPGDKYTQNSDITLYAIWKAKEYDVIYNANGGSGAPSNQKKIHGITLTLSTQKPKKDGHVFQGWGTNANDTTVDYNPGDKYIQDRDITLYAIWKPVEYSVVYNANGGSGAPSSQKKKHDITLTLSSTEPTRTGHTFQGWGTSENDTGVDYRPGDKYKQNSDIILYAIWKVKEYDVVYNANGGSGAPSNQKKIHGTTLTLSTQKPKKDGYIFQGWGTSANDTSVDYKPGDKYTNNSGITLYAIWKPVEYSVVYNANGGSGAPSSQKKKHDITLTLSSTEPTRTGHTFQGWGTSANDTSVDYRPGDKYTKNSDITLYAIWKVKEYDVKYNANGGKNAPSTQKKKHGTNLTLSYEEPSRTGYIFQGWGTSVNDTSVDYKPGDKYTQNSGITLYAIWKAKEYDVAYDANGGSNAPSNQKKKHGVELTLSTTKPTRTGYNFRGWGTSANDTSVDYNPGDRYTQNSSITLYAIWKAKEYDVAYNANGGSNAPSTQKKIHGVELTLSSTKPTRTGYIFQGWGTSKEDKTVDYNPGDGYTKNKGIELYAIWKAKEYVVVYNANGGDGAPESQIKKHGTALTLSSTKPTRKGYTFKGWGTSEDDTTTDYKAGGKYKKNSDVELFAIWKLKEYKVTYDANGGNDAPESQIKYHGEPLRLSDKKPAKKNYTFVGWSTSKDSKTVKYNCGDEYTGNKALKLYAVWIENQKITAKNITKTVSDSKRTVEINATRKGNAKLTYKSNNKNITVNAKGQITIKKNYIGKATITITAAATNKYTQATKKITVTVNPVKATISSLKYNKGIVKVLIKENIGDVKYEIQYKIGNNSEFRATSKSDFVEYSEKGYDLTGTVTKGKTYYFRVRGKKTVNGVTYCGAWSEVKKITIK